MQFTNSDINELKQNSREKLPLSQANYRGTLFKPDLRNGILKKNKLRVSKKIYENPKTESVAKVEKLGQMSLAELLQENINKNKLK